MFSLFFFIIVLAGLIILPYSVRFGVTLWGSIFQIYTLSVFGFYPSLALLGNASLAPTLISFRRSFLQPPILFLLGLFAIQIISLTWSPDRHFGFTTILYEIPFIIMYLVAFHLAQHHLQQLLNYIKIYAVLSLIPLMFIIVFAIKPSINLLYVKSVLAHYFNHPHAVQWYLQGYPEAVWQGKPRGIIFDPNAAGGYLGICALVFFGVGIYCRSTWLKCIAVLHWVGIFFTSVVAAMCLAIISPILITFVYFYAENKPIDGRSFRSISFYVITLLILIMQTILALYPEIMFSLVPKLLSRPKLWLYAFEALPNHLSTGLGFGGLEQVYAYLNPEAPDKPMYRPHNTLIAILAQSGIFAASLALAFIVSVFYSCRRAYVTASDTVHKLFVLFTSSAILWMFVHAMGENWGIVSEIHMQPIVATVYGLMMGLYCRATQS
jgi:hypothetical protein